MPNKKYNLPLKLSQYGSSSLAWGIRDEIFRGEHTFDGLKQLVLEGRVDEVRRYAEVLYHTFGKEDRLFNVIIESINERAKQGEDSLSEIAGEFWDWGFRYSSDKNRVTQDIKVLVRKE